MGGPVTDFSFRSHLVTQRTYKRPHDKHGEDRETWPEVQTRVIGHQRWLWERALGRSLNNEEESELSELQGYIAETMSLPAGRTLWLGGTEVAKTRESSQFNCAFTKVQTVYDLVDFMWLLLQGTGIGGMPVTGTLTGFRKPMDIEVARSTRTDKGGDDDNHEYVDVQPDGATVWHIVVGDSAESWAKAFGKLMAGKHNADKLVLDLSQIRPSGERLSGYGWICSGDHQIADAMPAIARIMNKRAGALLSAIDILDVCNHMGTVLSSRRSAQIMLLPYGHPEWREFALAKKDFWVHGNWHRQQSNNSLVFYEEPTREQIEEIFDMMSQTGGAEPGLINAKSALQRAPWFAGVNPCAEILLGDKSFCNLVETDLNKFRGDSHNLRRAIHLIARANYRQTCVDLNDGILQESWDLNNDFLRLCGVSLTGIVAREDMSEYEYRQLERIATASAYSMADELDTPYPKNVTTIKPSGTLSKVMDTTEGAHRPVGRYVFNNITFSVDDPVVDKVKKAGYRVFAKPGEPESVLITVPEEFTSVEFTRLDNGMEVNIEPALAQLNRYLMLQRHYVQHNTSVTVSYDAEEVPAIIDWLCAHWSEYVGVSFMYRADPTVRAQDLGFPYLPQEVVTKAEFDQYKAQLQPVDLEAAQSMHALESVECAGGACPAF